MKGLVYAALAAVVIYFILEWKAVPASVAVPANTLAATLPSGVTSANQVVVNSGGPNNPGSGSLGATPVAVSVQGGTEESCPTCGSSTHNNMVPVISRVQVPLGSVKSPVSFGGTSVTSAPKYSGGLGTAIPERSAPIASGTIYLAGVN